MEKTKIFHRRRMLYKSINMINGIIIALIGLASLFSILNCHSLGLAALQTVSVIIFLITYVLFRSNILLNNECDEREVYSKAGILYIMMLIGIFPICVLVYTHGNPSILSDYGISAIKALSSLSNLLIPISIISFMSLSFWLEVAFSIEESVLYIKCHELKKSILE